MLLGLERKDTSWRLHIPANICRNTGWFILCALYLRCYSSRTSICPTIKYGGNHVLVWSRAKNVLKPKEHYNDMNVRELTLFAEYRIMKNERQI